MRNIFLLLFSALLPSLLFAQTDSTIVTATPDTLQDNDDNIPVFTMTADDLENQTQSQDVSTLLQSSRDVFSSVAGYNFSAARFRIKGLNSDNYIVMLNGVPMNDPESGWAIWANWGGLNDITRYQDSKTGISASQYNFGGIGGYSNINIRASQMRKGTKFSQSFTNRTYQYRTMLTYNTGVMSNGWAISASMSTRLAHHGYVEGTYYSGLSYFLSAEKKLNDKHSIGVVGMGAPTYQARSGLALQEAYDLTGTNYYNPYWGYQNGVVRNARVRNNHKPIIMLYHTYTPKKNTTVNSTLFMQTGRSGQTNLNWYDAKDPRPDYYKYLPSYYAATDPTAAANLTSLWQNDVNTQQINWDQLYFANTKNLYTVNDANGTVGNNITGNRSKYIVEEYRTDPMWIGVTSNLNSKINDNMIVSGALNISSYTSHNFKIMNDLLGGDFWVDVDQFAEQDFADPTLAQNDLNNTNGIVKTGDKFGYNYDMHKNSASLFAQIEYTTAKVDYYAALQGDFTQFWRTGNMKNGLFPDNSYGDSEKHTFTNYGAKAGAVYKLSGRHLFSVNAAYLTRAPKIRNAFLSPKTRDAVVSDLGNEEILSTDISYHIRYPRLKLRATWYYTEINNQVWNRSFYHDQLNSFVNYVMTGVDQLYTGVELGVEGQIASSITLTGAFSKGEFLYNSRPSATITVDNSSEVIAENRTVYLKNYKIGGMPQVAANVGVKYSGKKYWFAGANFNWFDDIWLSANPDRRTEEAVSLFLDTDPQWGEVIDQTKLSSGYTVDLYGGKSFRIKKYYLFLMLNVSNVLDNTDFITGGYEQLRYNSSDIGKFPPKYSYMYGRTYYAMIRLSF